MAERMTADPGAKAPAPPPIDPAARRFVLWFIGLSLVFFCAYYFPYSESGISEVWTGAYLEHYAKMVGTVLHAFEPNIVVSRNVISGRFAMSIVKSCDAMEANMLFCAAVLAAPGIAWRKATALAAGLAALVAINVVRLCTLYWVGVYLSPWFEIMHIDVWPLLMIVFATIDFAICVRWLQPRAAPGVPPLEVGGELPV